MVPIVVDTLRTVSKDLRKRLDESRPFNHCIVKFGYNTEKGPGDLGKLTVTRS